MNRISFLLFAALLISCNGGSDTSRDIQNDSDRNIEMLLYNSGVPRGDTLFLDSGERKTFSLIEDNDVSGEEPDCSIGIDSAWVRIEGGGRLTKLIQSKNNWEVETDRVKVIPVRYEHNCVFVISDDDIEE